MNRGQPKRFLSTAIFGALWLGAHALLAQAANPATEAAQSEEPAAEAQPASEPPGHLPSWKVTGDPVTVVGKAPLREEDLIGPYRQPRWTARRRFGETRVYVIPEGDVQFEYWLVPKLKRDGEETEIEQQLEIEIGLPRRFQLDLYAVTHKEGNTGTLALDETKLEVRWALADWGKLWGNPAVYLEWKALSGELGARTTEFSTCIGAEEHNRVRVDQ